MGPCWLCKALGPIAVPFAVVDGKVMDPAITAPVWACGRHVPASDIMIGWRRLRASDVQWSDGPCGRCGGAGGLTGAGPGGFEASAPCLRCCDRLRAENVAYFRALREGAHAQRQPGTPRARVGASWVADPERTAPP